MTNYKLFLLQLSDLFDRYMLEMESVEFSHNGKEYIVYKKEDDIVLKDKSTNEEEVYRTELYSVSYEEDETDYNSESDEFDVLNL